MTESQIQDKHVESQIKFYEDHLKHLESKKHELNHSFYISEKEGIEKLIQQLKSQSR